MQCFYMTNNFFFSKEKMYIALPHNMTDTTHVYTITIRRMYLGGFDATRKPTSPERVLPSRG